MKQHNYSKSCRCWKCTEETRLEKEMWEHAVDICTIHRGISQDGVPCNACLELVCGVSEPDLRLRLIHALKCNFAWSPTI